MVFHVGALQRVLALFILRTLHLGGGWTIVECEVRAQISQLNLHSLICNDTHSHPLMTSGRMCALTCMLHTANERTIESRCLHAERVGHA